MPRGDQARHCLPQRMPLPRSAPVVECDLPCQSKAASALKRMRQCQAMTAVGRFPADYRRVRQRLGCADRRHSANSRLPVSAPPIRANRPLGSPAGEHPDLALLCRSAERRPRTGCRAHKRSEEREIGRSRHTKFATARDDHWRTQPREQPQCARGPQSRDLAVSKINPRVPLWVAYSVDP